jgi:hypothetical protein
MATNDPTRASHTEKARYFLLKWMIPSQASAGGSSTNPTTRSSLDQPGLVFDRAPAGAGKRSIDLFDMDAAVFDGLDGVGGFDQLAGGGFGG